MRRITLGLALAALVTTPLVSSAAEDPGEGRGELTSLGVPLQDVLLIGGTVAPGPDGETALFSVSSGEPAHLNAVDPATGEALARFDLPGSSGAWATDVGPDGSVWVGTYGDSHLFRWTADGGVEDLGNPIDSATFVWDVAVADDGYVVGGTYPDGKLFGYDPDTGEFRDFGQVAPGHSYARSVATYGDLVFAGTEDPAAVSVLDRSTGEITPLPLPDGLDVSQAWAYDVDVVGHHLFVRFGDAFPAPLYVWDIEAGSWVDSLESAHGLEPSPPDEDGRTYLIQDGELVRYDPADGSLERTGMQFTGRVANTRGIGWAELGLPDYPGRSIVGHLWRGKAFRYNPETGAHSFIDTTIEGEPIGITAISDGPDERVYVGGFLNGGFAALDPASGDREEFHTFSQSEAMTNHGGRLFIGAYPDARVYGHDPAQPWHSPEYSPSPDPGATDNPARLFDFKAERQIRPRALTSAGDYLAVGTMPDLNELGGVFALYDAASDELVHAERNLITDQSIVSLTYADGVVYGSTSIYGGQSATPPTQPEAKVFAWSVDRRELLWETAALPGQPTISGLSLDDEGRLWAISGPHVVALDTETGTVAEHYTYGDSTASSGDLDFNPVDGQLYANLLNQRFARIDPATGDDETLREGSTGHVDVHPNGDVYVSAGAELFRYELAATCEQTVTGTHAGGLTVDDATCIEDAVIHGPLTVTDGASVVITDSTINGSVRSTSAAAFEMTGSTVRGATVVADSTGAVTVRDNSLFGPLTIIGSDASVVVAGNRIIGSLHCADNAEAPHDDEQPNTVAGAATGQCAAL